MNTRKDYWRAVRVIRVFTTEDSTARANMSQAFVEFFSTDNPRFDAQRFTDAVNAKEE